MFQSSKFCLHSFDWSDYNFNLKEFVDPKTFAKLGAGAIGQIDVRLVPIAQALRDHFGPVRINDWAWSGKYQFSGYRPKDCKVGADHSQHRRGCAIDVKIKGVLSENVRNYLRENFGKLFKYLGLTTIEKDTKGWVHLDTRYTGMAGLFEVNG